ncbi:MAG: hypothetical protein GW914_04350, partial [Candidatus Aenigmarchaeota archaeon]|nr:hypothetical protein [Candidatus Aenigmarchaeota archaeon]
GAKTYAGNIVNKTAASNNATARVYYGDTKADNVEIDLDPVVAADADG